MEAAFGTKGPDGSCQQHHHQGPKVFQAPWDPEGNRFGAALSLMAKASIASCFQELCFKRPFKDLCSSHTVQTASIVETLQLFTRPEGLSAMRFWCKYFSMAWCTIFLVGSVQCLRVHMCFCYLWSIHISILFHPHVNLLRSAAARSSARRGLCAGRSSCVMSRSFQQQQRYPLVEPRTSMERKETQNAQQYLCLAWVSLSVCIGFRKVSV